MKRFGKMCLFCLLAVFILTATAYPLGLGIYEFVRKGRADADVAPFSFGVLLDTNMSKDSLLNFRYQIGYGSTMKNEDMFASLGFGLVRTELIRFWLGPQIGVSFQRNNTWPMPTIGAVLGINFNFKEHYAVSIDGGIRYMIVQHHYTGNPVGWNKPEPFLGLSVLFRFGEASGNQNGNDSTVSTHSDESTGNIISDQEKK